MKIPTRLATLLFVLLLSACGKSSDQQAATCADQIRGMLDTTWAGMERPAEIDHDTLRSLAKQAQPALLDLINDDNGMVYSTSIMNGYISVWVKCYGGEARTDWRP